MRTDGLLLQLNNQSFNFIPINYLFPAKFHYRLIAEEKEP